MTQHNDGSSYGSGPSTHEKVQRKTMNGAAGREGGHSHPAHEAKGGAHAAGGKETVDAGLASLDHCTYIDMAI
jgi:hypothetical protein